MWVGSVREKRIEEYVAVYEENTIKITRAEIDISPALLRVYVEALSNAVDNVERSRKTKTPCTLIEVNVNKSTGETSVWNDGDVVPIEIHSGEGCYNHTMIFGQLLTGSNYNDDETRMMSGRNGIGIKATSIFSKEFTVEGVDPKTKRKLIQKWTNNMRDTDGPVVSTISGVKGYTLVKWKPEFSRFDVKGYTTDIVNLYRRYAVDAGMLTKIRVTFNGEILPVSNLESYAKLYENLSDESIHIKHGDCEVLVTPSSEFQAISFVNGVCTRLGGAHVDSWCEALFRPLVEKFNKGKKDKPQINIKDIKQFFRVFVVATVGNPEFDSQEKNKLEAPRIDALVKPSQIIAILKWSVCEQIKDMIDAKEMLVLKKVERKKKGFVKIEGMDQANFAGTKYSKDCTLILCEGLSAKTYAVAGIEKGVYGNVGRNFNGIMPLMGKCCAFGTKVILWNGEIKNVEDVNIGDYLINDVGEKTEVKEIFTGNDEMYEVQQNMAENYTVNSQHTLTLKISQHLNIMWSESQKLWSIHFFDRNDMTMKHKYAEEYEKILEIRNQIDPNDILDIDIQDYLRLPMRTKKMLRGFRMGTYTRWEKKDVPLNPYTLGLWLGCLGNEKMREIEADIITGFCEMKAKYGKDQSLNRELEKYNLVENKHIPMDYIVNDKETRLKLLAGIIDANCLVNKKHKVIIIHQSDRYKNITDGLMFLCRSLGMFVRIDTKNTTHIYNGEKSEREEYIMIICGGVLKEIPTQFHGKNIRNFYDFKNTFMTTPINVVRKGAGRYVGFRVDNTNRFLLRDFTVTHNCLNARNSSPVIIAKNKEITNLIKALGLSHGTDYTIEENFEKLRYGRIMCLTDADVDGIHIEGLILNMFHYLFPTLLHRKNSFIVSMKTPIVRIHRPMGDLLFYDERRFKEFISQQTKKLSCKYYKGLGTTKLEDVPDTFGVKMIEYVADENTDKNMSKIFGKKQTDDRKEWLEKYTEGRGTSLDDVGTNVMFAISDFIDNEMIKFSIDDCRRSIPSGIDGLKQSQRKVLYAVRKRNLRYNGKSLKVAQLGGYVAEHTNYHHGEQNLYETITKMANEFPASNNIPLLYRDGQFGSRLQGGHDAASARYIFTKMDMLTNLIFRPEDDVLLEHVIDDGDVVEPTYYVPILPMILINGCSGIGTGWSSNVPCYNPLDLIKCVKIWLDSNGNVLQKDDDGDSVSLFPELTPWYRGFDGQIEKSDRSKYITHGILEKGTRGSYVITELPIGVWTNKYKDFLEDYAEEKVIKDIKNYSTVKKVNFVVQPNSDELLSAEMLKLHSYVYTSNMVMFNEKEQLRKYTDTDHIIDNFCKVRYELYCKRKNHQISDVEAEIRLMSNKERFIREVMSKSLNIMNVPESEIICELGRRKYDKISKLITEEGENEETTGGYEYLLRLQVRTFTTEKINKLNDDIKAKNQELKILRETSEKSMWIRDLVEFTEKYQEFLNTMEKEEKVKSVSKPKIVRKK
jgi:DNA gyrase/topoisomerase IV subunit B